MSPTPRCPNCAAEVPPDAAPGAVCGACGKPLADSLISTLAPEPDGPQLPVDDELLQCRYPLPLLVGVLAVALVGFAVAFPFGLGARFVAGCVAGLAAVAVVTVLLLNATTIKRLNRDLLELQSGEHLAKWEYSSAEWLRFVAADWRRGQRWGLLAVAGLVCTAGVVAWMPRDDADDREARGTALCGTGAVTLFGVGLFASEWRTYRRRRTRRGVAFIGHGVACVGGCCALWGRSGWRLSTVRVVGRDPAVLELVRNASESRTEFRIPIPHGREDEANRLVRVLMNGPGGTP